MKFLKYGKRIFSTILVICMIIGMMPISAFAVETDQIQELDVDNYDMEVLSTTSIDDLPEPTIGHHYRLISMPRASSSNNNNWYSDSGGNYNANNLIDGNTDTFAWLGVNQNRGTYMQVDLRTVQKIDTVSVTSSYNHSDFCENAEVQVSKDGNNWTKVGEHTGSRDVAITDTYNVNSYIRYIRVVITTNKGNWWRLAEISWTPKMPREIENGTYIIVNGNNKAMTNTPVENPQTGFANEAVTINDGLATPLNSIYEWTFEKQSNGTYYITDCNGKYLNINNINNISVSDSPQEITVNVENEDGKVQLSHGEVSINYFASNGQIYSGWNKGVESNNLQSLYKKIITDSYYNTLDLYDMLIEASSYDNSKGRYGTTEFAALQKKIAESIEVYKRAYEDTSLEQSEIDEKINELNIAIETVKNAINYIEVPIEILDFRADGVMFEYRSNTNGKGLYELLTDKKDWGGLRYGTVDVPMPGVIGDRITHDEWNGWDTGVKRTGLVEDYLVNGAPVYKEETVDYVAKIIAKGFYNDGLGSVTNRNSYIAEKIAALSTTYEASSDTNSNLGNWADTLSKTSTGLNGGDLTWDKVESCYDLAYYVLNNMWRSVEDADGSDAYNKIVGERTTMRLQQGEDGYYTLDSTKAMSYDGSYMYNTDLSIENNSAPRFTPINGLGYESADSFGDTTDTFTNGTNFHFTLNMRGAFVYNADDDLYFYFDGDDDVYFYINGHLVMDIGGAHPHCDGEIHINTIADAIGLEDGGIYTFDMFYAERHTEASNLVFKTNIKIMDTMSLTSKEQYNIENNTIIPYGSIVSSGTTVAYNFGLLNMRSVPVFNISFEDESLGTNISKDGIKLYDDAKTNGAVTNITDVIVYYHTYDRPALNEEGVINSLPPTVKTVEEIQNLINTAKANNTSLETGSYKVSITSDADLKTLLALGIPIDTQICVYGIKRNVINDDRPYTNTVTSKAYYISNGNDVELHGVASQKLTVLNSFSATTDKEQIVIDYGKPVQIDISKITENIHLNDGVNAEFYGITFNGYHNRIRTTVDNVVTALNTECNVDSSAGKLYLKGTNGSATAIEFQLKKMLSKVEKAYAVYTITDNALQGTAYETYYLFVEFDIIPATNVYYETDFVDGVFELETTGDKWSSPMDSGEPYERDTELQDSYYKFNKEIYGYDSSYILDSNYSNGSSLFVKGQGVKTTQNKDKYTEARFSFTGTGFDVISRTGANEGAIRVDVYSDAARTNRVKSVTVLNKSESGLELYQIPVVSVEMPNHGTYYVTISVNAAYENAAVPSLSRGDNFYFDAVRIFNPIDVTAGVSATGDSLIAYNAYCVDDEANAVITEVRNSLIDANDYNVATKTEGMAFVDRDKASVNIATYKTIGPNNEVYLINSNQAIAFKITADSIPKSVDIGAKSANGKPVTMVAKIASGIEDNAAYLERTVSIETSTTLFYDLADGKDVSEVFNNKGEAYVFISNSIIGDGILSITDIKIAYENDVTPLDVTYQVDSDVAEGAKKFLLSLPEDEGKEPDETVPSEYDILSVEFDRKTGYIFKDAALKVKTSQSVEQLKVTSYMRWVVYDDSSYVDTEDGYRMWTIKITPFVLDSQTYKVVGYGEDGTAGAPMSAALDVKWK